MNQNKALLRRVFLRAGFRQTAAVAIGTSTLRCIASDTERSHTLDDQIGIVTASANAQLTGKATGRNFTLLELPEILKGELDLQVVDLNTSSIQNFANPTGAYLDKLRNVVAENDCILTNLKMNQRGIDMNSVDRHVRERALAEYRRSIDIAARLGCRWARPLPSKSKPDMTIHVDSYRRLCDYAADRNVTLLVENFGWMQAEPDSVARLVAGIGENVAAGVDTGNWNGNPIRYEGLEKTFPIAVTCDFKARRFDASGAHREYDLRRCFEIAWSAGFRGPWALEYANRNTATLFRDLSRLRDMLRGWTATARAAAVK